MEEINRKFKKLSDSELAELYWLKSLEFQYARVYEVCGDVSDLYRLSDEFSSIVDEIVLRFLLANRNDNSEV